MKVWAYLLIAVSVSFCAVFQSNDFSPASPTVILTDQERALHALEMYFSFLHRGEYEEAVQLYGGSYESLLESNRTFPWDNRAKLLEYACERNGYNCLLIRRVHSIEQISPAEFQFIVEFQNQDGSLFVRTPCCGAGEGDSPPQSQFMFTIIKNSEGKFLVMELPVYTP